MLIYDAETDGLLEEVTKVHCLNILDRATKRVYRFTDHTHYHCGTPTPRDGTIRDGLKMLSDAPAIGGQNIVGYDDPVFFKLFGWRPTPGTVQRDTLVESRVIWTNMADVDFGMLRSGKLPEEFQKKGLIGTHKLAAWGYRLGCPKGDFDPKDFGYTWANVPFLREMDDYCAQDVTVTDKWFDKIDSKDYSWECLELEQAVAVIIRQQSTNGFAFDVEGGTMLHAQLLKEKIALDESLRDVFPPWKVMTKRAIAKANNKTLGRVKGEVYEVWKEVVFNPGSRDHIADRLKTIYGWKPTEFTDKGKPKVDETILSALPWEEAKKLTEYLTIIKRLGQLADGKEAWLKAHRNGRIHGSVNTNGAVTGRMTHSRPNVAQADKWKPMRALWIAAAGLVLIGCDAEGLELRALAHYMARWDGGAYGDAVVNGKKEDGTDVHTVNQHAVGLNKRDAAKTFIYALIYGAGDHKLGSVIYDDMTPSQQEKFDASPGALKDRDRALATLGRKRRARLMERLPALAELTKAVKAAAAKRGHLKGIDGRLLHVRGAHSALNTLLQSAGAVAMKKALVIFVRAVEAHPNPLVRDVKLVANVHDEFQMEAHPDVAQELGQLAADSIRLAGEHFGFRCPLAGAFDIGANWSETH
ncbi:DNA polymerase [Stenotrophomonas maltophilia]|uniref:DNA polymerase n=1 Tax=Stenotrophomonas maltophilia TaxID=40324 RepID=UPI002091BF7A|nr:DNA polymerase [Stenotrophomonas maltophilia]MCO5735942.1 DNA polymerase [Stenotrophomonas maltophilia]